MSSVNRREFIELGLLSGLLAAAPGTWRAARAAGPLPDLPDAPTGGRPRNVIVLVADGMSMGTLTLAEAFSQQVRGRGTIWLRLLQTAGVAHALMDMRSLNSLVTDSSAASSVWGSGSRVFNNAVNILPDGTRLTPLAPLVHDSGRRFGLVTTTTITHATPAGFAAVQPSRDDEREIAPQYLDKVDVLLGGGRRFFDPALRRDRRDLFAEYRARGYTVVQQRAELTGSAARPPVDDARLLGLFADKHLPFSLDWRSSDALQATTPTLAEMTRTALDLLGRHAGGYVIQIEGGRVDHAAHANDAAALLWDQLAFDDALEVALETAEKQGETLILITTDHGNANPGLIGLGSHYEQSDAAFARVAEARWSFEEIEGRLRKAVFADRSETLDAAHEIIREATGIEVSKAEARSVVQAFVGTPPPVPNRQLANWVGVLGAVLTNYNGIGWTGLTHTADWVLLTAVGPGHERFAGYLQGADVYRHVTELLDIRHRNPTLTPEQARPFRGAARPAPHAHWA